MSGVYCEKCSCITWSVFVNPYEGKYEGRGCLNKYRYCPNCKKIYEINLTELRSSTPTAKTEVEK